MDLFNNLSIPARGTLQKVIAACGGVALLVGMALLLGNITGGRTSLTAAVAESTAAVGGTTLTIAVDPDYVNYNSTTAVTWSVVDPPGTSGVFTCFGDGTTCGAPLWSTTIMFTYDWKAVTIDPDTYLVSAQSGNASHVYKWMPGSNCFGDGTTCDLAFQSLGNSSWGTVDIDTFTIGTDTYLVLANNNTASRLYKWDGVNTCFGNASGSPLGCGVELQQLGQGSWGTKDVESTTINDNTYLIFANRGTSSRLLRWSTTQNCFGDGSSLLSHCVTTSYNAGTFGGSTRSTEGAEFFTMGTDTYMALANQGSNSRIYKWVSGSFSEIQDLGDSGGEFEYFTVGSNSYLALTDDNNASTLFQWMPTAACFGDGVHDSSFYCSGNYLQIFPANIADNYDWQVITAGTDRYLVQANLSSDSYMYKWMSGSNCFGDGGSNCGIPYQTFSGDGNFGVEIFTIGYDAYMALANNYGGTSYVYKAMGAPCFGDGNSCNAPFWSPSTAAAYDWKFFTAGTNTYLLSVEAGGASDVYKWRSDLGCFGNNSGCNGTLQSLGLDSWDTVDAATTTINGVLYLILDNYNAYNRVYQWDEVNECFGNGSGLQIDCGQELQTFGSGWDSRDVEAATIGVDTYLFLSRSDTSNKLLKWSAAQNCFGDGSSNPLGCGATYQDFGNSGWNSHGGDIFTMGINTYLAITSYSADTRIYQWMPTAACFGDGVHDSSDYCSNSLQNRSDSGDREDATHFSIGANDYLAIANTGNSAATYKWSVANNCFGNTSGNCSYTFQTFGTGKWNNYEWHALTMGTDTYLALANYSRPAYLYKWMSGSNNCFGSGSNCGDPAQFFGSSGTLGFDSFNIDGDTYLALANNSDNKSYLYKWTKSGGGSTGASACSVKSTDSGGQTLWSTNNSGTFDNGELTENTAYTLTCQTPDGPAEVAVTVTVGPPTPVISITPGPDAAEPSTNGTFTITSDVAPTADLTVYYTVSGGTATEGVDYTALSGFVTILAGQTSATITVAPIDDLIYENPNETVEITIAPAP